MQALNAGDEQKKEVSVLQVLGFQIGECHYAINVNEVQEIIGEVESTCVPTSDETVRGLINLRGEVVTSIDLRSLLGLPEHNGDHVNIIVRVNDSVYSLAVDNVLDVIDVDKLNYHPIPETLSDNDKKYVECVYKLENLLIMLNLERMVS